MAARRIGSYDASIDHPTRERSDPRVRGKFVGCIRAEGAVRWSCWHAHDSAPDARQCAHYYMTNVDPEVAK